MSMMAAPLALANAPRHPIQARLAKPQLTGDVACAGLPSAR